MMANANGVDLSALTAEQLDQLKQQLLHAGDVPLGRKKKARRKDTTKYLSEEQIDRFFRVIPNPRDVAMFRVIYHRGLRASEVGLLRDPSFEPGAVDRRCAGPSRSREHPIDAALREVFGQAPCAQGPAAAGLVSGRGDGDVVRMGPGGLVGRRQHLTAELVITARCSARNDAVSP